MGFVVISGLAKGIDTAAHEGALTTGQTIAVLGTPLDKVYPAENKQLAARIADSGALIAEYPLGYASRGQSFVERDRLQSGMSLAVVPVQTARKGGTQHTIRFATEQRRLLFCPAPQSDEEDLPAYDGIWDLIRSGRARPFTADDYDELAQAMRDRADVLLSTQAPSAESSKPTSKRGRTKREKTAPGPDALSLFDDVTVASPLDANGTQVGNDANGPATVDLEALVLHLAGQLNEAAPDLTVDGLDLILGEVRKRWVKRTP
jgi:DNA processing protein